MLRLLPMSDRAKDVEILAPRHQITDWSPPPASKASVTHRAVQRGGVPPGQLVDHGVSWVTSVWLPA
jgi:hypothetical protein